MTKLLNTHPRAASFGAFAAAPAFPGAPRIAFSPPDDNGTGKTAEELAAEAAAADAAAAAAKTADDKTAEEQAAADAAAAAAAAEAGGKDKGLLAEVMAKKNKIKELEANLAKFEGIDPVAVRALIDEKRAAELSAEEAKGNFARVKEMMVEEHGKATQTLQEQVDALTAQIAERDGTINDLTIGRSFSESTFIGDELIMPRGKARTLYSGHFEVVDGKIVGYDKPSGAKDRTELVGADGKPVSFEDAIKRIIDSDPDKDSLYRDKAKAGAGSSSKKVQVGKPAVTTGRGVDRILASLNAGK